MNAAVALLVIFGAAAIWAIAWLTVNAIRTVSGNRNKELRADLSEMRTRNERMIYQLAAAKNELRLVAEDQGTRLGAQLALDEITRLEIESQ